MIWGGGGRGSGKEKREEREEEGKEEQEEKGEEGREDGGKSRDIHISGCAFLFRTTKFGCEELLSRQPMWLSTPGNFVTLCILYKANQTANYNCFDYSVSKNYPAIDLTFHFIKPPRFHKRKFFLQITSFVINQGKCQNEKKKKSLS